MKTSHIFACGAALILLLSAAVTNAEERQGWVQQIGGGENGQSSQLSYDRGTQHYDKTVSGGTEYIPKDATNVMVNNQSVPSDARVTVNPQGAMKIK